MNNKVLVKFYWDCGRMGDIEGLFISTKEKIDENIGKTVYFGDVLGKHSDVYGKLDQSDIEIISEDQNLIQTLSGVFKSSTICGYNPLLHIGEDDETD